MLEMIQVVSVFVLCALALAYVFVCFACDDEKK
jgi:hypothetical protein